MEIPFFRKEQVKALRRIEREARIYRQRLIHKEILLQTW